MVKTRRVAALGLLVTVVSCDLGTVTVPRTRPAIVVHSILNPFLRVQEVMVSNAMTGATDQPKVDDIPIPSPITNARVTLIDPNGNRMVHTSALPTGIYNINLDFYSTASNRVEIQQGKRYQLIVVVGTDTVRGHTVVPVAPVLAGNGALQGFNRDRDSLRFDFSSATFARAFWIRVESAFDAFELLTPDRSVAIGGLTRNLFSENLARVFYPGFRQFATAVAVDSNVYDYYRSGSDPFSGAGLISRLEGGFGVFGSVVDMQRINIDVSQNATGDAVEGAYTLRSATGPALRLQLYLESPASDDVPARISGRTNGNNGIYGTREAGSAPGESRLTLQLLAGFNARDVRGNFEFIQRGDSLIGLGGTLYVREGR